MLKISKSEDQDGVEPTRENAGNGSYPIARPLMLYTNGPPQGAVKDYIDWILSDKGQKIVGDIGYVPMNTAKE